MDDHRFPKVEIEGTIGQRFSKQVAQYGDRPAFTNGSVSLSYGELNQRANAVANSLLACQIGTTATPVVALLCSQGETAIASILGILKAGFAYLPLDPGNPILRLRSIAEDAAVQAVVTDHQFFRTAQQAFSLQESIVTYEEAQLKASRNEPSAPVDSKDQACVLYTSGSTGFPKAVPEIHRNVLHNIRSYILAASLGPDDKLSLLHAHSFGASRLDIFGALLSGACLHHIDLHRCGFAGLADLIQYSGLTIHHSTPTLFRNMLSESKLSTRFSEVRLVHLGSEAVLRSDFDLFRKHFSAKSSFLNRYGTTETGTISFFEACATSRFSGTRVPAGYVVDGLSVEIEGANGNPNPEGEPGEVIVRSRYLSHGAIVDAEQEDVERVYRTGDIGHLRPDGCLVVAGRKDGQTKLHGKRVDLFEIEIAINQLAGVDSSVVCIVDGDTDAARLVAYYVPARATKFPDESEIRDLLTDTLPRHLIPTVFVEIDSLPITANTKLDFRQLPTLKAVSRRPPREAKGAMLELCTIFSSILGTEVGPDDNFFALGGDSLKALRLLGDVTRICGRKIALQDVFACPTPRQLLDSS